MKIFKRAQKEELDLDHSWARAVDSVRTEAARKAIIQHQVLDAIGDKTDDLADQALTIAARLPEAERTVFMRNVFRNLVLQTMVSKTDFSKYKGDDRLFMRDAEGLGACVLSDFGSGMSASSNVGFEEAIVDISIPPLSTPKFEN